MKRIIGLLLVLVLTVSAFTGCSILKDNEIIDDLKEGIVDGVLGEEVIIDDRDAKKRVQDVLNFVFYLGGNKDKVYEMYRNMTLYRYLREKMKITDLKTISEIESYVFYTFEDEIKKDNSYVKKGN